MDGLSSWRKILAMGAEASRQAVGMELSTAFTSQGVAELTRGDMEVVDRNG